MLTTVCLQVSVRFWDDSPERYDLYFVNGRDSGMESDFLRVKGRKGAGRGA